MLHLEENLAPPQSFKSIFIWAAERFPAVNIVSSYLLYILIFSFSQLESGAPKSWGRTDIKNIFFGGLGILLQFLVLRILDEHKDFDSDKANHPLRALSRGILQLSQLRVIGVLACLGTLLLSLAQRSEVSIWCWLAMLMWTALMKFEFFCPQWLKRHLFVYSWSHMLVIIFMGIWSWTMTTQVAIQHFNLFNQAQMLELLLVLFCNGMIYEVLRKTKGPEEEKPTEQSFSKLWGPAGAIKLSFVLLVLSLVLFAHLGFEMQKQFRYFYIPGLVVAILSAISFYGYLKLPTLEARKKNEACGALFVLVSYLSLIFLAIH